MLHVFLFLGVLTHGESQGFCPRLRAHFAASCHRCCRGAGHSPAPADTDGDGLPDAWEIQYNLNPNNGNGINGAMGDPDRDGLPNGDEYANGTNPRNADTDGDGLPDLWEVENLTDPLYGSGDFGANGDPDGDGLLNKDEMARGVDPLNWDTDGDGLPDGWEVGEGIKPNDNRGQNGPNGDPHRPRRNQPRQVRAPQRRLRAAQTAPGPSVALTRGIAHADQPPPRRPQPALAVCTRLSPLWRRLPFSARRRPSPASARPAANGGYTVTVCITQPANGATVSGLQTVTATATISGSSSGIGKLIFLLDGTYLITDYQSPYTFQLTTDTYTNGAHTLSVSASIRDGFVTSAPLVTLTFANAGAPPSGPAFAPVTPGPRPAGQSLIIVGCEPEMLAAVGIH